MSLAENIKRLREISAEMDGFDFFSFTISAIAKETAKALEKISAEIEELKKR